MFTVRAPGRVNLIGEHTDYSGGLVLPVAIDRRITIRAEPAGAIVALRSGDFAGVVDVPADGSMPAATGWGRYVAAVVVELAGAGRPPVGLRGEISSDLPAGSGLSSSAALGVAVATALCAAADFELPPLELAELCRRAEHRAVGVPVGIMDQAVSLLGRAGEALLLDCGTLQHHWVPLPPELALLVVGSGVERRLEESGYAARRAELEAGLADLGIGRPSDIAPGSLPPPGSVDPVGYRRVRHVVGENQRVRQVAEVLTRATGVDRVELGRLFRDGHDSLRDDFEVSTPEIDLLVDLAYAEGAVAARLTGGGFGGAIVVLADAAAVGELAGRLVEVYREASGLAAVPLPCAASDGASVIWD